MAATWIVSIDNDIKDCEHETYRHPDRRRTLRGLYILYFDVL